LRVVVDRAPERGVAEGRAREAVAPRSPHHGLFGDVGAGEDSGQEIIVAAGTPAGRHDESGSRRAQIVALRLEFGPLVAGATTEIDLAEGDAPHAIEGVDVLVRAPIVLRARRQVA